VALFAVGFISRKVGSALCFIAKQTGYLDIHFTIMAGIIFSLL